METKLIVKYRRPNDCWICPDCDAENDIGSNRCTVCGCEKNPSVSVLKAWSPELERARSTGSAKKSTSYSSHTSTGGRSSTSGYDSSGSEGGDSNIFLILMGVLVLLVLIIALAQA